jgi:DNA polymerase-3 subunit epsilon
MREIVLDTETTGLDPLAGHRVVEVGCIELVNTVATGKTFHAYFNPEMIMPAGAQDIHGPERRVSRRQAPVRRQGRGVPGVHRRRAARDPQRAVRHRLFNAELERVGKAKLANA